MHFEEMLVLLVHKGASDIHLHAGMPVLARIGDELRTVSQSMVTPEFTASLVEKLCTLNKKPACAPIDRWMWPTACQASPACG